MDQDKKPKLVITNQSEFLNLLEKFYRGQKSGQVIHGGLIYSVFEVQEALHRWHALHKEKHKIHIPEHLTESFLKILELKSDADTIRRESLQTFLEQQSSQIDSVNKINQSARLAATSAAKALGISEQSYLLGLARNLLLNNPTLTPQRLAEILVYTTHQTSTSPKPSKPVVDNQIKNTQENLAKDIDPDTGQISQVIIEQNREAIKEALGSGIRVGPAITAKPEDITHQITRAVSPHFVENSSGRNSIAERSARQIMKAAERLSTAANPINLSDKDIKDGLKESLRTLGNNRAAKVVDTVDSKLLRLALDQASQTTITHLQPEYSPTSGLTPLARANLRTITTLSYRQNEAPHLTAGKLIEQHYKNSPTYIPTPIQRFWQMIFPKQNYIQYNYSTLAPQITEYQSTTSPPPFNLVQFIKNPGSFFSGFGGGGGGGGGLGGGLKNLLSNGLTSLKNAFKLGRGVGTGAKALQSGVKMGGLASKFLSGLTLRNPAFWYYVILPLFIFGIVLLAGYFLHMKRTSAEVRPDYGQQADVAFAPIDCGFGNLNLADKNTAFPRIPVGFDKPSHPIAARAWEITDDLYQGFWCFFNRPPGYYSPDENLHSSDYYPAIFGGKWMNLFISNPNPDVSLVSIDASSLFWCTQLTEKAYTETGNNNWTVISYMSDGQLNEFRNRGKYFPANQVVLSDSLASQGAGRTTAKPGSIVFFHVPKSDGREANHVGIINHVDSGSLTIGVTQSNAGSKTDIIRFNSSGIGLQSLSASGITVVGIGVPD